MTEVANRARLEDTDQADFAVTEAITRRIMEAEMYAMASSGWIAGILNDRSMRVPTNSSDEARINQFRDRAITGRRKELGSQIRVHWYQNWGWTLVDAVLFDLGTVFTSRVELGEELEVQGPVYDLFTELRSRARRVCGQCSGRFMPWDIVGLGENRYRCYDCVKYCVACDRYFGQENWKPAPSTLPSGEAICDSCYKRSFSTCPCCEFAVRRSEIGSALKCHNCFAKGASERGILMLTEELTAENSCGCRICSGGLLRGYDADPAQIFPGWTSLKPLPKDKLFVGAELETEVMGADERDKMVRDLHKICGGFAIQKTDGSLNYGIEIVSMPLSLENAKLAWGTFLKRRAERRLNIRSWNTSTCGMHVHLSRAAMSELAIEKVAHWMVKNRVFCEEIAGRKNSSYAAFDDRAWGFTRGRGDNGGKYQALNVSKTATIEFRIFRGTLNQNSFLRNLEFTVALARWCRDEAAIGGLTVQEFARYVTRNRQTYSYLFEWMTESRYMETVVNEKPLRPHKPAPGVPVVKKIYVDDAP